MIERDGAGDGHRGEGHRGEGHRGEGESAESGTTMTKADIIESVYEKVGFSKKESSELVEIVFETMKGTLERGEKVKISGFGKFEVRYKRPRRGRNPQTNDEIVIEERNVLSFKPSQVLKNALAGDGAALPQSMSDDDESEFD